MAPHNANTALRFGFAAFVLAGGALLLGDGQSPAKATPAPPPLSAARLAAPQQQPPVQAKAAQVQITLATVPAAFASVSWGGEQLGQIAPGEPLILERKRDSGPLDLTIRAAGFLPVQTRAHTSSNLTLRVKLTRLEDISGVLGYRAPLEAEEEAEDAQTLEDVRPIRRWLSGLFRR